MGDERISRRSGETSLTTAQMVAMAVSEAISLQLPLMIDRIRDESDDNKGIKALKTSLEGLHGELKAQTVGINQRFDRVQEQLSEGAVKFAVQAQRLDQCAESIQEIKRKGERGGTTGLQRSQSQPGGRGDAPLINPKVWNILIIAALGTLGAGVGTYVVDTFRAGQKANQPPALMSAQPPASQTTPAPMSAPGHTP